VYALNKKACFLSLLLPSTAIEWNYTRCTKWVLR